MLYAYKCQACGETQEVRCSVSERPAHLECGCGAVAEQVFNNVNFIVKGNERPYDLNATSLPIGWENGNTGAAQERRYKKLLAEKKKLAKLNDRGAIKGGIRHVASQPREHHRLRTQQYGKDYYATDTKAKLKADGLLFHSDD